METKHLAAEIKATKDGHGAGSFEAILSMPTIDRDGEIVDARAFEPLPKKITIDVDHGLSAEKTIGSGTPFYDGDVLKVKGTFASTPLAQEIRTLVLEEHLGHMSVAYRAAQYETDEKSGVPHLRKGELVNAAIVGIPANREAAILVAKDATVEKVGARNSTKDQERIQNTHDHMVELGAVCGEKHAHDVDAKYLVGERGPELKSLADDPEVNAAAPAAAVPPAPTLMADAYVALAKARMLQLDDE